jgi:hypothetical protein
MFLIQFEFYPTKWSRFEKFSSPMFLEFDLVFYIIFPDFFLSKFPNLNFQNRRFLNSDPIDPAEFRRFLKKSAAFLNPGHGSLLLLISLILSSTYHLSIAAHRQSLTTCYRKWGRSWHSRLGTENGGKEVPRREAGVIGDKEAALKTMQLIFSGGRRSAWGQLNGVKSCADAAVSPSRLECESTLKSTMGSSSATIAWWFATQVHGRGRRFECGAAVGPDPIVPLTEEGWWAGDPGNNDG